MEVFDAYLDLVRTYPPRPIRLDENLMRAIAVIDKLLVRALDDGHLDYLDVLSDIVRKHVIGEHPHELLRKSGIATNPPGTLEQDLDWRPDPWRADRLHLTS